MCRIRAGPGGETCPGGGASGGGGVAGSGIPWGVLLLSLAACSGALGPPLVPDAASAPAAAGAEELALVEAPPAPPSPPPDPVAHLVFGGDVIPHGTVKAVAAAAAGTKGNEGWDAVFERLAPRLAEADHAMVNLETPIAPNHDVAHGSKIFNAPPALVAALQAAGVDLVAQANNHAWDQGVQGQRDTWAQLAALGMPAVGAGPTCASARAPHLVTLAGVRVAFIAGTRVTNGNLNRGLDGPCVNLVTDASVVAAQAKAAREAGAELVFLSMHWGQEYETTPRSWDTTLGRGWLEAGVDVLVGHHPHVLQPVERHTTKDGREAWIAYSLGNLESGQGLGYRYGTSHPTVGYTRDGALLHVWIGRVDGKAVVRDVYVEPTFVQEGGAYCTRELKVRPTVEPLSLAEASARALLDGGTLAAENPLRPVLERCLGLYAERRRMVTEVVGAEWVRDAPLAEIAALRPAPAAEQASGGPPGASTSTATTSAVGTPTATVAPAEPSPPTR